MRELTLTELLDQVTRLGGDPSTTLIQVNGSLLDAEAHEVERESGGLVVTLLVASESGAALRNAALYEAWRQEQHPVPAKLTARQRAQAADYVEERAS